MSFLTFAPPGHVSGATLVARTLKQCGVSSVYGVVGVPIVEVGIAAQASQFAFIGFRNEQSASYAASVAGYMSGRAQVCLCVAGPGVVHSLAGVANAWSNCWPLLLLAGAPPTAHAHIGAFQESPAIDSVKPFVKFAAKAETLERLPWLLTRALHIAAAGRPGPVYIELPAEMVTATLTEAEAAEAMAAAPTVTSLPPSMAAMSAVEEATRVLVKAQRPLVVVGKGAAYGRAEKEVAQLVEQLQLPFLPTPMGKGVMGDDHPLCVAAARTHALQQADVILLLGARLNWQLHFGVAPRFAKGVKFIVVDVYGEEAHQTTNQLPLIGDVRAVVRQMIECVAGERRSTQVQAAALSSAASASASANPSVSGLSHWKSVLQQHIGSNQTAVARLESDTRLPMSYYTVFHVLRALIPVDAYIVSEGANTMDIGRARLPNRLPRRRLDAGTFATMGVGPGFAIAAALYAQMHASSGEKPARVFCIEGDSAFGFSGMEVETASRYRLPIIFIVVNNSGIYGGMKEGEQLPPERLSTPVTALTPGLRYDKVTSMLPSAEARGFNATTPAELETAVKEALTLTVPCVINVVIRTQQERKQQAHGWLTPADNNTKRSKL